MPLILLPVVFLWKWFLANHLRPARLHEIGKLNDFRTTVTYANSLNNQKHIGIFLLRVLHLSYFDGDVVEGEWVPKGRVVVATTTATTLTLAAGEKKWCVSAWLGCVQHPSCSSWSWSAKCVQLRLSDGHWRRLSQLAFSCSDCLWNCLNALMDWFWILDANQRVTLIAFWKSTS